MPIMRRVVITGLEQAPVQCRAPAQVLLLCRHARQVASTRLSRRGEVEHANGAVAFAIQTLCSLE